ncbi:MAG: hypothetical protein EOM12_08045 [Verrucomicrobiae bacterium]|nr:hypothetical protein [Verrucomicrobiae bacterium]
MKKAWGKAGRETVKLLADLEEAGPCRVEWIDDMPDPEAPRTLLREVQRGIRMRTSELDRRPQDTSLQMHGYPNVKAGRVIVLNDQRPQGTAQRITVRCLKKTFLSHRWARIGADGIIFFGQGNAA